MKHDNLKRVRGILSARLGALVPKFNPGGKMYVKTLPMNVKVYSKDGSTWFLDENFSTPYDDINSAEFLMAASLEIDVPMAVPGDLNLTPNTAVEVSAELTKKIEEVLSNEVIQDIAQEKKINLTNSTQTSIQLGSDSKNNTKTDVTTGILVIGGAGTDKSKQLSKNEKWEKVGQTASLGIQVIGNAFGASQAATDSNLTKGVDSGVDAIGGMLSQMGGVAGGIGLILQIGSAAGQIIEGITGGTDLMTATDKFFDSGIGTVLGGWVNQLWGKNSDSFGIDQSTAETVGSSYGGSMDLLNEAAKTADKKYGLFSSKARKRANEAINKAKQTLNLMSNVADTATDQRLAVQSMGEQAGLAYSMMIDGGYNLKYTYAAKQGGVLEWEPDIRLEWEPQIELNWELPTFKDGGSVEFVEELEWIPEFKSGNKIRTIEELIEYAKLQNPRFIQRLSEEPRGIKFTDDGGKEAEGSHYLESRGEYVIPRIQEVNGELQFFNSQDALNRALETGNYLKLSPEEAIIFAEQYKQGWPDFFKKFKSGGSVGDSDIPKTEETNQKNVIPEGALHKNKHHMEHAEGLTKKGIPVVDEDGEQQAEIEHSEIIFTLEVTKKLEEYYKIFYSEESTNKEKEQAALDAGKLLVYQILENTEDRTGLIESCKKGGSLNLKKSTDDLIEEVLEWMPTLVIVDTLEIEENKKEDKPKAKKELSDKDQMKEAIKEVLIELLIK